MNLIDFSKEDDTRWRIINDGVMGGLSQSTVDRTERGTGLFAGILSCENSGGFASMRVELGTCDLAGYAGLELRVRGDGRVYQVRLRTDQRFDGIAYRASFGTRERKWMTVRVAFDDFEASFRGRVVCDAPRLDTAAICQLGFMLADKQPGPFALEIAFVRVWSNRGFVS